jgi:succinate dehydrogenase / fumarate reductase cytochrome b subunit
VTAPTATAAGARRSAIGRFWDSTVGKKAVMAVTGLIMIGFVIGHLLGNLLVFRGSQEMNEYADFLKSLGGLLWLARAGLLVSVILHVIAAVQLTRRMRAARPIGYTDRDPQVSTLGARTIRWGGLLLAIFIVYHLLHFTVGSAHPAFDRRDVYGNIVAGFQVWWVSLFYLAAMAALGLHIYHGAWSSLRTLGVAQSRGNPLKRVVAPILAILLWLGFSAIPIGVLLGLVK